MFSIKCIWNTISLVIILVCMFIMRSYIFHHQEKLVFLQNINTGTHFYPGYKGSTNTNKNRPVQKCTVLERINHIKLMCLRYHQAESNFIQKLQFINSANHRRGKIAFCQIQKNGCTSFKTLLRPIRVHYIKNVEELQKYSSSFKFFILRHPFDRLVSAYTDKMITSNNDREMYDKIRRYVIETYHSVNTTETDLNGSATFVEFLKMVIANKSYSKDIHWAPYAQKCHPCEVSYDYIARIETMSTDSRELLKLLNINQTNTTRVQFHVHRSKTVSWNGDFVKPRYLKEFESVPRDIVEKMLEIYKDDFLYYGYHFDPETNIATCGLTTSDGRHCC